jgi:hypothetical protein
LKCLWKDDFGEPFPTLKDLGVVVDHY